MPRRLRMHNVTSPHPIVRRSHKPAACFFAEEGDQAYLHWLREGLQETGVHLHAYVLMTDHVHLLTPKTAEAIPRSIWLACLRWEVTRPKMKILPRTLPTTSNYAASHA